MNSCPAQLVGVQSKPVSDRFIFICTIHPPTHPPPLALSLSLPPPQKQTIGKTACEAFSSPRRNEPVTGPRSNSADKWAGGLGFKSTAAHLFLFKSLSTLSCVFSSPSTSSIFSPIVQELCESRGGRPGLSVLTSLLVSVDVKLY